MRVIGIGGAGGKLAVKMDANAVLVNVSEIELEKVSGGSEHIVAPLLSVDGQFRGSRKNPGIGHDAYNTIQRRLTEIVGGSMLFSSTGGGTGNGITTGIIEDIIARDQLQGSQGLPIQEKTFFCLLLPCCNMEAGEYVTNTIDFISGPLAKAIDHGCTGNVVLFSNELKFNEKIGEDAYNQMIVDSLNVFMSIPDKNQRYKLLENHIDHEDLRHMLQSLILIISAILILILLKVSHPSLKRTRTGSFCLPSIRLKPCSSLKFLQDKIIPYFMIFFLISQRRTSRLPIALSRILLFNVRSSRSLDFSHVNLPN